MTQHQAFGFLAFAVVAAITPGPSNIILASAGANAGIRRGLPCLLGVTLGMGLMMFAVAFGLGSVVLDRPAILTALNWGGAALLLWLAWKIATSGRGGSPSPSVSIGFQQAAALQCVNPKSWLVSASAAGTYLEAGSQGAGSAAGQSATFSILFVLAAIPCCFAWLAFGGTLQRVLRTNRSLRAFNIAMGTILAASIVLFVV